ncbi:MAG: hypothetical protein K2J39_00575 [Ruminococcus sp.]|nr:hypothetical protein [Ruminococcus sp.]
MLNPYQYDRLYHIARKDGFDKCQETLYDACENVITTIEGDSYAELVKSLAMMVVECEKIIIALDSDYHKTFYEELEEEIRKQAKERNLRK